MSIADAVLDEARWIGHNYLGTEHLLLAFAQRPDLLQPVASLLPDDVSSARDRSSALPMPNGPCKRDRSGTQTVGQAV
jgi:Clp amino terminal domain, pathogenicity island component